MKNYTIAFIINALAFAISLLISRSLTAHPLNSSAPKDLPVLADLQTLQELELPIFFKDEELKVAFTYLTPAMQQRVHNYAHFKGRCGAFESLEGEIGTGATVQFAANQFNHLLGELRVQKEKNDMYDRSPLFVRPARRLNSELARAASEVSEAEIKNWLNWFGKFPTRYNKGASANAHVDELYNKLKTLTSRVSYPVTVDKIAHKSTGQQSLRVHIEGRLRPSEIVVLGGHYDSINQSGSTAPAPGIDDNASGSADILEALRITLSRPQPERSIDFFWYAGEESGLLGSAEIAKDYKAQKKNVIAVLQLDMTLYPGEGELALGNMEDFTSAWLRDYLVELNNNYLKAKLVRDQCGYGCSDHASWYRQGYATLMPFEATMRTMNRSIHTANDTFNSKSSLSHAAMFAKLAVIFALDLGNSTIKGP